ncbi:MAG: hypothetical protein KatS3mg004_3161 [Bryobacteraceae bacterium]|nr:MAG: hypothetical protein KatS3mg004_3161 [Bryobacteraceae bacterium]
MNRALPALVSAAIVGVWMLWLGRQTPVRPTAPARQALPASEDRPRSLRESLLEEARRLRPEEVSGIRKQLVADGQDPNRRALLMAWLWRVRGTDSSQERAAHVLWLIRNEPASEFLDWAPARFAPGDLSRDRYVAILDAWREAVSRAPFDPRIAWHAALWVKPHDPDLYRRFLESALEAQPDFEPAVEALAAWCVEQMAGRTALEAEARELLGRSLNPILQTAAAREFRTVQQQRHASGRVDPRLEAEAEACIQRARAISPHLGEEDFRPARSYGNAKPAAPALLDLQLAINTGWRQMRRLSLDDFPELPPAIRSTLGAMGCAIPQPEDPPDGPRPYNLIRGRFSGPGVEGWAALCSVQGAVRLLAFRDRYDTRPETLSGGLEIAFFQMLADGRAGFSWMITAANPRVIRRYHEAFGGEALPELDHDGIESHFLGKVSVIFYWHEGAWRRLQGAD